ncbi:MAG: metal ABC transporter substrate-binding protein [Candidatus Bathyarchaeia archaeon]
MFGISLLSAHDRIRVATTIEPLALIVKDIGGDRIDVCTIVPAYMDPHVYTPKPEDRILVESSHIFVCVGREEFLGYFEEVSAIKLGWDKWSRSMYIPNGNPHYVWLFPPNTVIIAEAIYTILSNIDPGGRSYYTYRFERFKQGLVDIARWVETCKRIYRLSEVKVALAGSHMEPLLEYLGIEVTGILMKGEKIVAPRDIAEFRDSAKSSDIILVHLLEYELDEGRIADEVSKETGVPVVVFNPLPVGYEDSYIEYMKIVSYGLLVSLANMKLGYQNRTASPMLCIVAVAPLMVTSILLLFLLHRRYRR